MKEMTTHSSILCKESDMAEQLTPLTLNKGQKTWVQSLGQEDPLKKELATHSSILAWRNPWTEEPGRPGGCKESDTTKRLLDDDDLLP